MIAGLFHSGSGIGDQLFRYITVRTLAEEKGYEWGMINLENFKGESFLDLEVPSTFLLPEGQWLGSLISPNGSLMKTWREKEIKENGLDIRSYDPEINFIEDNTIIDGSFEDDKYWGHNLDNISKWLAVEPLIVPDDLCIIGFRGGEYYSDPDLGLPKEYFDKAVAEMRKINPDMTFQVHTDDPHLAEEFFPNFEVVDNQAVSHSKHTNMGFNWRSMRYAKYAIIPNSAFFIIPRILGYYNRNVMGNTIAPRYWARHNTSTWARPACYYHQFKYIHASDN